MLAEKNGKALSRYDFKQVITSDPHAYNAFKNEYPKLGIEYPVQHFAEFVADRIEELKPHLKQVPEQRVTFHDPCYLGRYGGVFEPPRRVIQSLGLELREMPRNRDRAVCCGAGGGRIWMDEGDITDRPSEGRIQEAVDLDGVETFVVACPKDITMYRDALKTAGHEEQLVVKDLVELVHEAMQ